MKNNEQSSSDFPLIVCQVPHQLDVFVASYASEKELRELAEIEGGDNWEWPGHYDEDGVWQWDETTVEDMKEAIAHDMHIAYFISRDDYADWHPTSHHSAAAARTKVDIEAAVLGWVKADE